MRFVVPVPIWLYLLGIFFCIYITMAVVGIAMYLIAAAVLIYLFLLLAAYSPVAAGILGFIGLAYWNWQIALGILVVLALIYYHDKHPAAVSIAAIVVALFINWIFAVFVAVCIALAFNTNRNHASEVNTEEYLALPEFIGAPDTETGQITPKSKTIAPVESQEPIQDNNPSVSEINKMRTLNSGGKMIVVSGCILFVSMFMNWAHFLFFSKTGISLGFIIFLALWSYPLLMVWKNKPINSPWGKRSALASIAVAVIFLLHASNMQIFFCNLNVVCDGAWLFLSATILYYFGIILYQPSVEY